MNIIQCPHCTIHIEVLELNCRIFRCGIYKHNFTQINPHMSEPDCIHLINTHAIYGCGKPFQINKDNIPEPCSYNT